MPTKKETQIINDELKRLGYNIKVRQNYTAVKIYNEVLQDIIKNRYTDEFFKTLKPSDSKQKEPKHKLEAEIQLLTNPKILYLISKYTRELLKLRVTKRFYAEQRRAERKKEKEQRKKEDRINQYFKERLHRFQTSDEKKVTFKNLTSSKEIAIILKNLKYRDGYTTFVTNGITTRAVNQDNIAGFHDAANNILQEEFNSQQDYEGKVLLEWTKDIKFITIAQFPIRNKKPQGAFFKYLNESMYDLSRYGIFRYINKENYRLNCIELAFQNSKKLTEQEIDYMRTLVKNRVIPMKDLKTLAEHLNIMITVRNESQVRKYGTNEQRKIELVVMDDHYFLYEKTEYTHFSINHYQELMAQEIDIARRHELLRTVIKKRTNRYERSDDISHKIDSYNLVKKIKELNMFKEMELDYKILETQYHTDFTDIKNLHYNDCVRPVRENKKQKEYTKIFYADFETISKCKHKAYLLCAIDSQNQEYIFRGETCAKQFLDIVPKDSLIYFHNLSYDISFLVKYMNLSQIINQGSRTKYARDSKRKIDIRDSYAIIPEKLTNFTKMFNIEAKKEIMPYELYTEYTVNKETVHIAEALIHIKQDEKKEFQAIAAPFIQERKFNHMKYAEFYCMQDCRVLKEGFEKFNDMLQQVTNLSAYNFVSLPSIAYQYGENKGAFIGVNEIAGIPRMFIQRAVSGGRCMTNNNEVYHVTKELDDFDAVSLYPSAMSQMGFLQGRPKVIEGYHTIKIGDEENFEIRKIPKLSLEFLMNYTDGFFIEINNIKVNKRRQFPLQSTYINGIRNYTNDFSPDDILVLDKIATEDFINFQEATFDIIRGYYFNEGRCYNIKNIMTTLFNERKKHKSQKNPVEQIYKLIMNSFYGKTIVKERNVDLKFSNTAFRHEQFINYNYNFIKEFAEIAPNKYVYKVMKAINNHYNAAHVGAEVLSMSKRLMNEVMCLSEDIGAKIYYQDTDSMHIEKDKVELLSMHFEKKYKRKLIGKDLCQFHSDFPYDAFAVESYFLAKKIYIDKLKVTVEKCGKDVKCNCVDKGEGYCDVYRYHIRMKGIPEACLTLFLEIEEFKTGKTIDYMEIYKRLYNGETLTFDMARVKPCFKRSLNFEYETHYKMERSIKIPGRLKEFHQADVSENSDLLKVVADAHADSFLRELFSGG